MAKGSKRLRKKKQKQQQIQVIKQSGYSGNVNKLSSAEIQKQYTQIIQQNERKEKKRQAQKRYREKKKKQLDYERTQKYFALEKASGISMDRWKRIKKKKLDSMSLSDIKKGNFSIADFPELYNEKAIDFDKEYLVPDGKRVYFAFRALNGEIDISEELQRYSKYSNTELINNLKSLKNKPLTATRNKKGSKGKNIGSSGKAGEGQVQLLSTNSFQSLYNENYNVNRRANTHAKKLSKSAQKKGISFQHSGIDYHWQYISQSFDGNRATGYSKISIRKLLVIGNAVMDNIREDDRKGWYEKYRYVCVSCITIMDKILP